MTAYILVVVSFVTQQTVLGDINPATGRRMSGVSNSHVVTMQEFNSQVKCEEARKTISKYVEKSECLPK